MDMDKVFESFAAANYEDARRMWGTGGAVEQEVCHLTQNQARDALIKLIGVVGPELVQDAVGWALDRR
jgi:hypothetical protein